MPRTVIVETETFPIAGIFRIARGAKTEARVVTCIVSEGEFTGRGECVPYPRYDETIEGVIADIERMREPIANGIDRNSLLRAMPAGAARNAIDCALWDLEAKRAGKPASETVCKRPPHALITARTISLGTAQEMAAEARANADRALLKIKVGGKDDAACMRAVAKAAPESRLIVDANEGWNEDNLEANLRAAAQAGVGLIEQPLPAGQDALLRDIARPVPICADESLHTSKDLAALAGVYDAVNIKLDKAGGLTEALVLRERARDMGFQIMVGCMVGSSLAMAPAVLLAQDADFVDLDGPLLLARDRVPGLRYDGSVVSPPDPELWG